MATKKRLNEAQLGKELSVLFRRPGIAGAGARRLLAKLREKGFAATLPRVQAWLQSNEAVGPQQAAPPPGTYQRQREYTVLAPNAVHEADVLFLPTDPSTRDRYALTIVDLASRFKWAVPLRDKESGTIAKALMSVYDSRKIPLTWPKQLKVDAGKEFQGAVSQMLEQHGVEVRRANKADHRAQSMIESWNGHLARLIFGEQRVREAESGVIQRAWVHNLPAILKEVNGDKNPIIRETPAKAIKQRVVVPPSPPELPLDKQKDVLAVGTPVRVLAQEPDEGGRFRATDPRWSREVFKVVEYRVSPQTPIQYRTSWSKTRWLLREQLMPVKPGTKDSKRAVEPEVAAAKAKNAEAAKEVAAGEKYIVERIVRPNTKAGQAGYTVKWKGYPASQNTVEPRTQLLKDVPQLVAEFDKKHNVVWKAKGLYTWKK